VEIINHREFNTLELVVYGTKAGKKCSKRYLDLPLLEAKLTQEQMCDGSLKLRTIINIVLSRLEIVPTGVPDTYEIFLKPNETDNSTVGHINGKFVSKLDFEMFTRPKGLKPYVPTTSERSADQREAEREHPELKIEQPMVMEDVVSDKSNTYNDHNFIQRSLILPFIRASHYTRRSTSENADENNHSPIHPPITQLVPNLRNSFFKIFRQNSESTQKLWCYGSGL
jgi:hypothetical protein